MEKIRTNYFLVFTFVLLFILITISILVLFNIVDIDEARKIGIYSPIIVLSIVIFSLRNKSGQYLNKEGISCIDLKGETFIEWHNITFSTNNQVPYLNELIIKNKQGEPIYRLNYFDRKSFLKLIKKYCPPDHELYKFVQEYAKNKEIPF